MIHRQQYRSGAAYSRPWLRSDVVILLFSLLATMTSATKASAATLVWQLGQKFAADQRGIALAIGSAKAHFVERPDDVVILRIPPGRFYLAAPPSGKGTIDLSGIQPGPQGRLVFQGAGKDRTTLVFNDNAHAILGKDVYRVSFIGMHMTRNTTYVTQGHVVDCPAGAVILEIQPGFPNPKEIFNRDSQQGRYLRAYTDSRTNPQLIEEDNRQVAWDSADYLGGTTWRINLRRRDLVAPYRKGELVAVKSKHGGQAYWFARGSDILFQDVKWTQESRGVFRNGFDKVHFVNCDIDRAPAIAGQTPCLSTPDGGPQIGQPGDPPTEGNVVEDCRFVATGDDSVAFFNGAGIIRNCHIQDSFGRGILLDNSPNVVLENNEVLRCPVLRRSGDRAEAASDRLLKHARQNSRRERQLGVSAQITI